VADEMIANYTAVVAASNGIAKTEKRSWLKLVERLAKELPHAKGSLASDLRRKLL
jgi:hypothetical protein